MHYKSNFGVVCIYLGFEFGDVLVDKVIAVDMSFWVVVGNSGNDRIGWDLVVGDVDLDGQFDLLVVFFFDEV